MHAYAYIGSTNDSLKSAENFAQEHKADFFSVEVSKISEIRKIISDTNLKFSSPTVFVFTHFDKATEQAQNAFLKRLEEPQENLTFILLAENENAMLPTILSRVTTRYISKASTTVSANLDTSFFSLKESEKLTTVAEIKKREDALLFIKDLVRVARSNSSYMDTLDVLHRTISSLSHNGNPRIQLTQMVIQLHN